MLFRGFTNLFLRLYSPFVYRCQRYALVSWLWISLVVVSPLSAILTLSVFQTVCALVSAHGTHCASQLTLSQHNLYFSLCHRPQWRRFIFGGNCFRLFQVVSFLMPGDMNSFVKALYIRMKIFLIYKDCLSWSWSPHWEYDHVKVHVFWFHKHRSWEG